MNFAQLRNYLDHAFGHATDAYIQRWNEQKLTGSILISVNMFKGGLSSVNISEKETIHESRLTETIKFSQIQ